MPVLRLTGTQLIRQAVRSLVMKSRHRFQVLLDLDLVRQLDLSLKHQLLLLHFAPTQSQREMLLAPHHKHLQ